MELTDGHRQERRQQALNRRRGLRRPLDRVGTLATGFEVLHVHLEERLDGRGLLPFRLHASRLRFERQQQLGFRLLRLVTGLTDPAPALPLIGDARHPDLL